MRIIDEITQQEIFNPDLNIGHLLECVWVSPEAYATIDNDTKFALDDSDYETVKLYHRWTEDEIAQHNESKRQQEHQEIMNSLPDAMADLSEMVSDNTIDTADLQDALAELSEIVSGLMK